MARPTVLLLLDTLLLHRRSEMALSIWCGILLKYVLFPPSKINLNPSTFSSRSTISTSGPTLETKSFRLPHSTPSGVGSSPTKSSADRTKPSPSFRPLTSSWTGTTEPSQPRSFNLDYNGNHYPLTLLQLLTVLNLKGTLPIAGPHTITSSCKPYGPFPRT